MVSSLGDQLKERSVHKTYLAVVKDLPKEPSGTLRHFLQKDGKTNRTGVSEDESLGECSEMNYRVLASSDSYHLLEVQLIHRPPPSDSGAIGGHRLPHQGGCEIQAPAEATVAAPSTFTLGNWPLGTPFWGRMLS